MQSLKATLLVDVESLAILDVSCSTGKPHDSQIGWHVVKRNGNNSALKVFIRDNGCDWDDPYGGGVAMPILGTLGVEILVGWRANR
jgi:hypothetical protein